MRWLLLLPACLSFAAMAADKHYQVSKLETGLEVVTIESHKVPLVTIVLTAKAGGMTETPQTRGLTHLWEHMFFKGNKRLPNQEAFNKRIRNLGIVFNGDTSAEVVRYYFTLPSAHLDEGLEFMADAISSPLLDQGELEKERRVVLDEYDRSAAQPSFDFSNLVRQLVYGDKSYLRDPLGLRPIIEKATREQLFKIKEEVFVPSNSALLIAGDFQAEDVAKKVRKHFASWQDPKGWKPVVVPNPPAFPKSMSFVMTREDIPNAGVQSVFEGPKAKKEVEDSIAADVLISLLDHRSGKFYKKFVDSGLSFGAGLSYHTQSQAGQLILYAQTLPENAEKIQKMLLEEISAWGKPGYFTPAQLADVHRSLAIRHKLELNKTSEYIKSLAFWWAVTGMDYYGSYLHNLQNTSLADVQNFVKKWLVGRPHISGILVAPKEAVAAGLKDNSAPLVEKYLKDYQVAAPSSANQNKGQ